jgi:hypothetical protein
MASVGDVDGIRGWGQANFLSPFYTTVYCFVSDRRLDKQPADPLRILNAHPLRREGEGAASA